VDPRLKVEESAYYWREDPSNRADEPATGRRTCARRLFCGRGPFSRVQMAGFRGGAEGSIFTGPLWTLRVNNHPGSAAILGDIRRIPDSMIHKALRGSQVDCRAGGVPCQGFSLAIESAGEKTSEPACSGSSRGSWTSSSRPMS